MMNIDPKKVIILLGVIIAFILILIMLFMPIEKEKDIFTTPIKVQMNELDLEREKYGFSISVFEELPNPPSDFKNVVSSLHDNEFKNYSSLPVPSCLP